MSFQDNDIIALCQSGDQEAFWQVYDRYIDQIYKFVYLKLWDTQIAEDITSDVFFKVFQKIWTYQIWWAASFKTWIFRVAYNTVIDHFRTKKEHTELEEVIEFIGYEDDFWKEIDNKETIRKILEFLDTQPPKVKEICIMRFWDDLSFKEIAEITGESVDNCKKIVSRTLQKMPTELLLCLFVLLIRMLP